MTLSHRLIDILDIIIPTTGNMLEVRRNETRTRVSDILCLGSLSHRGQVRMKAAIQSANSKFFLLLDLVVGSESLRYNYGVLEVWQVFFPDRLTQQFDQAFAEGAALVFALAK